MANESAIIIDDGVDSLYDSGFMRKLIKKRYDSFFIRDSDIKSSNTECFCSTKGIRYQYWICNVKNGIIIRNTKYFASSVMNKRRV